jgi:hypothetical protein
MKAHDLVAGAEEMSCSHWEGKQPLMTWCHRPVASFPLAVRPMQSLAPVAASNAYQKHALLYLDCNKLVIKCQCIPNSYARLLKKAAVQLNICNLNISVDNLGHMQVQTRAIHGTQQRL